MEQGLNVAPGAVIEYVICVDASKSSVAERAYHPKTVLKAEGMLQIDTAWYMAQQLYPPIWRLCEPIQGLESAQIANSLGLDPEKFQMCARMHRTERFTACRCLRPPSTMCRLLPMDAFSDYGALPDASGTSIQAAIPMPITTSSRCRTITPSSWMSSHC